MPTVNQTNIALFWKAYKLVEARISTLCVIPNCSHQTIKSHLISNATLRTISENGQVLSHRLSRVNGVDQYEMQSVATSSSSVSLPLFCKAHDNDLFITIDKSLDIELSNSNISLLCLRTIAAKYRATFVKLKTFTEIDSWSNEDKAKIYYQSSSVEIKDNIDNAIRDLSKLYTMYKNSFLSIYTSVSSNKIDRFAYIDVRLKPKYDSFFMSHRISGTEDNKFEFDIYTFALPFSGSSTVVAAYRPNQSFGSFKQSIEDSAATAKLITNLLLGDPDIQNMYFKPSAWSNMPSDLKRRLLWESENVFYGTLIRNSEASSQLLQPITA